MMSKSRIARGRGITELRRKNAEALKEKRANRTDQEQLDLIEKRRGESAKEKQRLLKRMESVKEVKKETSKEKKQHKKAKQKKNLELK